MAVDYAHPVLTDVYAASGGAPDWPSYIRDNFTAMGTMFEGLDPAGKTVGFKRVTAGGLFERWNGSAWVAFPLAYFSSAGGTLSGALAISSAVPPQLTIRSNSATVNSYLSIGRTANESYIGISAQNGGITTGDAPGEMSVRAESRLWLSSGAAGMIRMDVGSGIQARYSLQATGEFLPVLASGIRLGVSAAQPNIGWYFSGGAADSKYWDLYASTNSLVGRAINDANTVASVWIEVVRTGGTISAVNFPNGIMTVGAAPVGTNHRASIAGALVFPPATSTLLSGIVGSGNSTDYFTYDGKRVHNYGLAWIQHTANTGGPSGILTAYADLRFVTSQVDTMIMRGGLVGVGRIPYTKILEVSGGILAGLTDSESLRIVNDGGYISWYNSAHTLRKGYMQMTGNDFIWSNEQNGVWYFVGGGANRFIINNDGYVYAGTVNAGNRVITAKELSSSGSGAVLPGGARMQWGTVTTTLGAGAVVTFPSAFSTFINLQATLNGGSGTGWVLRTFNPSTTTFQFNMDNWNTAGMGNTVYIWWFAIGT